MTLPVKSLVLMAMLSLLGASSVNAKSVGNKEQPRPDPEQKSSILSHLP